MPGSSFGEGHVKMRLKTLKEAQLSLPELVEEARGDVIGLTDDDGNLVGLLKGLTDDDVDDLLVKTPQFQAMMARAHACVERGEVVSAEEVYAEIQARLAREQEPDPQPVPHATLTSQ
jgi:hypothetical protein